MSTYVGEIIEIKIDGKWETLKTYYDASYCLRNESGEYPEDVIVYKSDGKDIVETEWSLSDNSFYQLLLVDSGEFDTDRGFPEDVSEETKRIYDKIPNFPSIPSYYTLSEFKEVFYKHLNTSIETIENRIEEETQNLLNEKVDWIIEKLENPNIKPIKFTKLNKSSFWDRIMEDRIIELMNLQEIYSRLIATVSNAYPNYIINDEIRVIWFIY